MISIDDIDRERAATQIAAFSSPHLTAELTETLKLAVPIALTQLGQIAMMTTDLALDRPARRRSRRRGGAGAHRVLRQLHLRHGTGLRGGAAGRAGVRRARSAPWCGARCASGLWAALLISLPIMPFSLLCGEQILLALGQAPATAHLAQQYLFGLVWGIAPALWFLAIRGFMGAVNRPEPGLWITLAAIPANALLVYLLIHGEWGLPRLELFGAGLATTIVNFGMFLAALWFAHAPPAVPEISRAGPALAHRLAADAAADRDRRADLDVVPAGIRPVRRGRTADGPDQHHRAGGAPDRAAGHRDPVHGAVRHRHGGHRAGRACRRPQRCERRQARGLCRDAARHRAGLRP